ncbi:MAG: PQQ-dependent sugar dehydrogenase [Pirellulales bacterium]
MHSRYRFVGIAVGALLLSVVVAGPIRAAVKTERIISGLNQPLYVTAAPGDASRLFIVEKGGAIKIYDRNSGTVLATPFLNLAGQVSTSGERGLLGLAFHPDYASNGEFFINYTNLNGATQISRILVSGDANVADVASQQPVLSFATGKQPQRRLAGVQPHRQLPLHCQRRRRSRSRSRQQRAESQHAVGGHAADRRQR